MTTGFTPTPHRTECITLEYLNSNQVEGGRNHCIKILFLNPITEYGWENIEHKVLVDGLTKAQAEQWEDRIIQALSMNGMCINKNRSGGLYRDDKQSYMKQWEEDHKEERKTYNKQRYEDYNKKRLSTPEGKIYNRVKSYNLYHTPIETPMEAKQKYLEYGYIPTYIKNNDLI